MTYAQKQTDKKVKFLHCADLHLDSPFSLLDAKKAETRKIELRSVFSSAVMTAKAENVDLFFISGDLFDSEYVNKDTIDNLIVNFNSFKSCRFFISPGNHDPYNDDSPYKKYQFPDNVHIFTPEKQRVELEELGVDVYGFGFPSANYTGSPVLGYPNLNKERINILVCHGDITSPLSTNGPISKKDIACSGFDYIALGHIHKASELLKENGTYYAYPGCIEGRGFDETGHKGVIIGVIDKKDLKIEKVKLSKYRYEIAEVDLTDVCTKQEAINFIREKIASFHDDTILKLTLRGNVKDGYIISPEDIGTGIKYPCSIEIIDKTIPLIDYTEIEKEKSLISVFYKEVLTELAHLRSDSEEYDILLRSLKYGLAALQDRDITNI